MKQKKKRPENPFDGEFIIPGYETSADGKEWVDHNDQNHDDFYDWKFEQETVLDLPSGDAVYEGSFSIYGPDFSPVKRSYAYHTAEQLLFIDCFDCFGDFEIRRFRHRVERLTGTEFRLYPLTASGYESGLPHYRMKIKQV